MTRTTLLRVVKEVAYGVATGIVYYLVYGVALPLLISSVASGAGAPTPTISVWYLGFFVALGTAESVLEDNVVSIPLRVVSKLLGALLAWQALNGGHIAGSASYGGVTVSVEADVSPLLYVVVLVSLLYGFIDAFTFYTKKE